MSWYVSRFRVVPIFPKPRSQCLRKVAKSVCGGHDNGDDESPNHRKNSESVVNNTCGEANITGGSTESMSTK